MSSDCICQDILSHFLIHAHTQGGQENPLVKKKKKTKQVGKKIIIRIQLAILKSNKKKVAKPEANPLGEAKQMVSHSSSQRGALR